VEKRRTCVNDTEADKAVSNHPAYAACSWEAVKKRRVRDEETSGPYPRP
jgi:hypothetical protein